MKVSFARVFMPAVLLSLVLAAPGMAQTARVTGVTSLQFIQLRPIAIDSVPIADAPGAGLIRRSADGYLVRCITGDKFCRFTRSAGRETVAPIIQDIDVSAWGFGRGIRVYAQLRSRATVSGRADLWPQSDDRFDALSAFIEMDRSQFRLRGGRQWKISGLGYYNFDGGSVLYRARPDLTVELFGGWSLARGLNEPRTSESIAAIETFAPDKRGVLLGGEMRYRPSAAFGVSALYQREIRSDRAGLYTERVAVDGAYRWTRGSVTGTLEADVASREVNDARLTTMITVSQSVSARAYVRAYRPFFELWTIWGAFDPVGFRAAGGALSWKSAAVPLELGVDVSRRSYEDHNATTVFGEYRNDGWSFAANGSVRAAPLWLLQGDYRVDVGFGAARTQGSVRVQHDLSANASLGVSAVAFQQQFELRVAEGTVYGLGIDGRTPLGERSRVSGSLSTYRHVGPNTTPDVDWSQLRGMIRFEWTIGPEPGMNRSAGGGS